MWLRKKEIEVAQSCLTLCNHMDDSLPGSSVHWIFQATVLEWAAVSFSNVRKNKKRNLQHTQVLYMHRLALQGCTRNQCSWVGQLCFQVQVGERPTHYYTSFCIFGNPYCVSVLKNRSLLLKIPEPQPHQLSIQITCLIISLCHRSLHSYNSLCSIFYLYMKINHKNFITFRRYLQAQFF